MTVGTVGRNVSPISPGERRNFSEAGGIRETLSGKQPGALAQGESFAAKANLGF